MGAHDDFVDNDADLCGQHPRPDLQDADRYFAARHPVVSRPRLILSATVQIGSCARPPPAMTAAASFEGIEVHAANGYLRYNRFDRRPQTRDCQLCARKVAFISVATPIIFVFLGGLLYMAGNPVPDEVVWQPFGSQPLALWFTVIHSGKNRARWFRHKGPQHS
jgi:hypothetical protein